MALEVALEIVQPMAYTAWPIADQAAMFSASVCLSVCLTVWFPEMSSPQGQSDPEAKTLDAASILASKPWPWSQS